MLPDQGTLMEGVETEELLAFKFHGKKEELSLARQRSKQRRKDDHWQIIMKAGFFFPTL